MGERWKEIPGFPGYEASDQGRVRSYKKRCGSPDWWEIADEPQRILSPSKGTNGYLGVNLAKDGETHYLRVAALVVLSFVGPCPEGKEICHNNGDPSDNRLENLRYDTHKSNIQDAIRHGNMGLESKEVIRIRQLYAGDTPAEEIAIQFGIARSTVQQIGCGCSRTAIGGPITKRTPGGQTALTEDEVIAIRKARANGKPLKALGEDYDRTESAMSYICSGRSYSQYGGPLTSR